VGHEARGEVGLGQVRLPRAQDHYGHRRRPENHSGNGGGTTGFRNSSHDRSGDIRTLRQGRHRRHLPGGKPGHAQIPAYAQAQLF